MNAVSKPCRDDRREGILAIAREVFMEEGYAAASMSAIAARIGGSKGTLYNYFRSKAELFTAVIRDDCERSQEALFDLQAAEGDLEKVLLGLGRGFVRLMLSEDVLTIHRIVVAESARFPEIGEAHFQAGPKRGKERLVALLVEAVAAGKLKPLDADRAADQLAELLLAGLYRRRLWNMGPPPTEADIDANVHAGVAVFMAAYGAD
jgi:TetR/AcrR family transcriptional repressor of mexJK operon